MTLKWKAEAIEQAKREAAERLIRAAVRLQAEHQKRLSVGNPAPHDNPAPRGDYPRARSGFLRSSVALDPTDPRTVARTGRIRIGYRKSAFYGSALAKRGWKGIVETAMDIKGELAGILGEGGTIG